MTKRSGVLLFLGLFVLALAAAASVLVWRERRTLQFAYRQIMARPAAEDLVRAQAGSVIPLEISWRLETAGGRPLYQVYTDNAVRDGSPVAPGAANRLPVFVLLGNALEPVLTVEGKEGYRQVGGVVRGAGIPIDAHGRMIAIRQVAEPWSAPYVWPDADRAGIVLVLDDSSRISQTAPIRGEQFPRWIPAQARFVTSAIGLEPPSGAAAVPNIRYARAYLSGSRPAPAKILRDSGDFALVQVDAPEVLSPLRLARQSRPAEPGESVLLFGPRTILRTPVRRELHAPELTGDLKAVFKSGEVIELDPEIAAEPLAGTPVFDANGRVFAAYTPVRRAYGQAAFAVPLRRAAGLIGAP